MLAYLLVFLSGCSSLIYEILWIKRASLSFGSSSLALATVLAIFFLGLGLGSFIFGRLKWFLQRPLFGCAIIEVLLALNGLLTPLLFTGADQIYGLIYRGFDLESIVLLSLRFVLVAALLLPPTILMGGTLPLFCRQWVRSPSQIAASIGRLYGTNTFGATVGCALTGFVLLPAYGITVSTWLAVLINLLAGFGFYWLSKELIEPFPEKNEVRISSHKIVWKSFIYSGILFFLIGAVALSNELLWTRFLNNLIRNSIYTYTITLTVVLAGNVLGSFAAAQVSDKARTSKSLLLWFAVLQAASSALTLFLTHLPVSIWLNLHQFGYLPYIVLMLPPAIIAGASFPIIYRIAIDDPAQTPRLVGGLTALNILGCVFGSLITGFTLLPSFGLDAGIYISSGLCLLAAILALVFAFGIRRPESWQQWGGGGFVAACVCLWLAMPSLTMVKVPEDLISRKEPLLDFAEGYNSTLAIIQRGGKKALLVNQAWQGSENKNHQIMVAHIPMMHYPEAKDLLVVGLGVGQTASRFLYYDIDSLDIVDIEPRLFNFVHKNFASEWMGDARVNLIAEDGRSYVKNSKKQYDLLSVEVGQLYRPGVDMFYTREFYQQAKTRLRNDGMLVQFVPLEFLRAEEFSSILKTFLREFPEAKLWYNTNELLLIGFKGQIRTISPEVFNILMSREKIKNDVAFNYWGGPSYQLDQFPALLGGFLATGNELRCLADGEGSTLYSDDWPLLAYQVSNTKVSDLRAVTLAGIIQNQLSPLKEALLNSLILTEVMEKAIEIRKGNVGDLAASNILELTDYSGTLNPPKLPSQLAAEALQWNPNNLRALKIMGTALIEVNRDQEAIGYLKQALALDANDSFLNKRLGFVHVKMNHFEAALPYLERALSLNPVDSEAINARAIALINLQRVEEAVTYFRRAADLEPNNPAAQRNLQAAEAMLPQH